MNCTSEPTFVFPWRWWFRGLHGEGRDVLEISQQTASPFPERDRRLKRVNRFWQSDLPGWFDLKDFEGG